MKCPLADSVKLKPRDAQEVESVAKILGLHWEDRILCSYLQLFEILKARRGLDMRDLTFENFEDWKFCQAIICPPDESG